MEEIPVLIIGSGPAGAALALLLGRQGVKSVFVSRYRGTANTPRAHILNQRAMEVLRDAGIEKRMEDAASPAAHMEHTSWSNTLSGEEYGRVWAWGNRPSARSRYETASPCQMSDLPQSYMEPILVDEAVKAGAEVRFRHDFVSLDEQDDGVTVVLRERDADRSYKVKCQYLVGADGARSPVVEAVKIPIIGRTINAAFNVHIQADLTKYMTNRPGSLNWVLNTDAPDWSAAGNFRMVRPWHEWVVSMHPATKEDGPSTDPSTEQISSRLHQMIGDSSVAIKILSAFRWNINDQVAETWQTKRVLCIGDAVHRHPPINGLGSNTCISDAFNLGWKLAYVLHGWAGQSLLDTLTTERKPVGDAVVRRANEGMEAHRRLWAILGLTPDSREKAMARMEAEDEAGKVARRELSDALEETDKEFQALGIQMNQIYSGSAATVAADGDRPPDRTGIDMLREVLVSTHPGYHLPHVWLASSGQASRVSTLDLSGHGRFVLFTGRGGKCWTDAAKHLSRHGRNPELVAYTIGFRCDYMDCYRDWERVRGIPEEGVVLVRPDHFVAWRYHSSSTEAQSLLQGVLDQVLGKLSC